VRPRLLIAETAEAFAELALVVLSAAYVLADTDVLTATAWLGVYLCLTCF
jgi:hypothetical protein